MAIDQDKMRVIGIERGTVHRAPIGGPVRVGHLSSWDYAHERCFASPVRYTLSHHGYHPCLCATVHDHCADVGGSVRNATTAQLDEPGLHGGVEVICASNDQDQRFGLPNVQGVKNVSTVTTNRYSEQLCCVAVG